MNISSHSPSYSQPTKASNQTVFVDFQNTVIKEVLLIFFFHLNKRKKKVKGN